MAWHPCSPFLPVCLLSGCIPAPPRAQASPQRDTADLAFVCEWRPRPPITKRVIVDLSLHAGQFNRTPTADDIRAVEAAGGRVVYQFRAALLRAELDTGSVHALVNDSSGPLLTQTGWAQLVAALKETHGVGNTIGMFLILLLTVPVYAVLGAAIASGIGGLNWTIVHWCTRQDRHTGRLTSA